MAQSGAKQAGNALSRCASHGPIVVRWYGVPKGANRHELIITFEVKDGTHPPPGP